MSKADQLLDIFDELVKQEQQALHAQIANCSTMRHMELMVDDSIMFGGGYCSNFYCALRWVTKTAQSCDAHFKAYPEQVMAILLLLEQYAIARDEEILRSEYEFERSRHEFEQWAFPQGMAIPSVKIKRADRYKLYRKISDCFSLHKLKPEFQHKELNDKIVQAIEDDKKYREWSAANRKSQKTGCLVPVLVMIGALVALSSAAAEILW